MSANDDLPLGYMAVKGGRRFSTSLSFTVAVGNGAKVLNANYLRLVSLQGQEQVSEPYQFTLVLRGNALNHLAKTEQEPESGFGTLPDLDTPIKQLPDVQGVAQKLLGQWGQAKLGYSADFKPEIPPPVSLPPNANQPLASRYFNGIVSAVSLSAPGEYTVELASPLFPLTLRNKYYVYKSMTIQGVIGELVKPEMSRYGERFKVDYHITGLSASRVQDWLQAGETDFSLLQRLMNKAAIHFYFIHREDGLTLVFSNQPSRRQEVSVPGSQNGQVALRYSYTDVQSLGLQQADLFCNLNYKTQLTTKGVQSVLARQEANWETNAVAQYTSYPVVNHRDGHADFHFYKNFSYGVNKDESAESLSYIDQQIACQQTTLTGESTSYLLSPGYAFTLTQQAINPSNASTLNPSGSLVGKDANNGVTPFTADNLMLAEFDGKVFVVTKITHKVSDQSPYSGEVEATPLPSGTEAATTDVLITPFNMQDTQQGSVLAIVVESAVPKSSYFLEKGDFHTELSATRYGPTGAQSEAIKNKEIGCVVQFATDEGTNITHWVALSEGSQTAPAVSSMVMVGRGDNESEIPQIQQVLSSHGQKTIQPALWRNNSWTFNTSWGSNCSTNYGDSLNIHFGSDATPDLKTAMNIVQTAYENPSVLNANFGGASYDIGSSFSYSTTSQGAKGLANASVSQGSHFSESHSDQDYSVSYNNCRQSYSQSNKSVNISYQGSSSDSVDENNLSFINGKIPNQEIIDICNGLPDGSSYNRNHITGNTINLNGTGAAPPDPTAGYESFLTYSNSVVAGDTMDISEVLGNSTSVSNFAGTKTDTSTVTGATTSTSTFLGAKSDISVVEGLSSSLSTMMAGSDTTNIITGAQVTTNTITGDQTTTNTITGAQETISTVTGDQTTTNTISGAQETISTVTGDQTTTNTISGAQETINTITGDQTTTHTVSGAQETICTITGDQMTTNTISGAQETTNTTSGAQIITDTISGDVTHTTTHNGLVTKTETVDGVETVTKLKDGVVVESEEGPVATHTSEQIISKQLATMNITVEGVLSIL